MKLPSAIQKDTVSFPGSDNFETHTGHLVFYFNLISPSLVSGNAKQKMRGQGVSLKPSRAALAFPCTVHWETPCGMRHSFAGTESVKLYFKIKKKVIRRQHL